MQTERLRRLVLTIGLCIAVLVGISIPAGYFGVKYTSEMAQLDLRAKINAEQIARYIYLHKPMWQYQSVRLSELIDRSDTGEILHKQIIDITGNVVLDRGERIPGFTIKRIAAITVAGENVGFLEVEKEMVNLAQGTAFASVFGLLIAFAVIYTVLVLPMRALDKTIGSLQRTNSRFDMALSNMSQGLIMFDKSNHIVVCNQQYLQMYDLDPSVVKPGCSLRILLSELLSRGHIARDLEEYHSAVLNEVSGGKVIKIQKTAGGREIQITKSRMPQGGWVATHEDITERQAAQAKIAHMAHHDALTGLPNRLSFRSKLERRFQQRDNDSRAFAVLCFDLDRFKNVNDTLGHGFGDLLLCQVTERFRKCLRTGDTFARLGGDEFAILQSSISNPAEIDALASRLIEVAGKPFDLDGRQAVIGVSIGIALAPTDASEPDELLKNADLALYRAKADGRGTFRFFEPEMDARMQKRHALEIDLRKALQNQEFELYYQPIVRLESDEICGFEALLRWNHPVRGIIAPTEFITVAEETELIIPIGQWVLRQACQEAVKWPDKITVAVNISAIQFKMRNLAQMVITALASSGLPASRLELEITESVLLFNNEATLATLHQLRELGVKISMDDFGTGYSSLSYLRSFPFDKIKIDRSFVHGVGLTKDSMAIVRAVTSMGASLGMLTTGEGIETQAELDYLRQQGCTEGQGFFFSRPKPASEVFSMLSERTSSAKAVA